MAVVLLAALAGCGAPSHLEGKPYHHTTAGFRNPPDSPARNAWSDRMPWLLGKAFRVTRTDPATLAHGHVLDKAETLRQLSAAAGRDSITWIGHMTALLRMDGRTVLTDPFFSDYATPLPPLGPKRYVPPALTVEELPPIDVVVISHSHFEHLDLPSIRALPNRARITAVVPLRLGWYFRDAGYGRVIELDWEESAEAAGLRFTALPVIHWSKRSAFATNDTLWAAFAIEAANGARVYFGGDAEYGPIYSRMAARHGGFDLALLSIGAFLPRIVMHGAHCVPEDCVRIGTDLDAHTLLAMHWGTIQLGDDTPAEGVARFRKGAAKAGVPADRVWVMKIGETRPLPRRQSADADGSRPAVAQREAP